MSPPLLPNTNNDTEIGTPEFPEFRGWHCSVDGDVAYSRLNPSMRRLHWTLNGPLTTAISVMPDLANPINGDVPDGSEPYYRPCTTTLNPDNTTTTKGAESKSESESEPEWPWHPISKESFTDPPISSVRVRFDLIEQWEFNWLELHSTHSMPPGSDGDCGGELDPDSYAGAEYGPLPDHDEHATNKLEDDDDDDWSECNGPGTGHLISCCGSKRPRKTSARSKLLVSVSARVTGAGGAGQGPGYLTVHDYIEQIHPWMMSMRGDILRANVLMKSMLGEWDGREDQLLDKWGRDEKLLFVDVAFGPKDVGIMDEEEWVDLHTKVPTLST